MKLQSKLSALFAVLIADLLFFLFFNIHYPEVFETVLTLLPWNNNLEKAIMVISGLIIAVSASTSIVYILVKHLQKMRK